jgi:hypothetical protein
LTNTSCKDIPPGRLRPTPRPFVKGVVEVYTDDGNMKTASGEIDEKRAA